MYGYVRPPLGILKEEETERFRRMYCGLCHTLGRRYGLASRFILNYDFTYLAILLSDREEGERDSGRCPMSPIRSKPFLRGTDALALAADESVILAYWQLRDGVADHDWLHGWRCCGSWRRRGVHRWIRRRMPLPLCWALPPGRWWIPFSSECWGSCSITWDAGCTWWTRRTI